MNKPTKLQKKVYEAHLERFGEPDVSYRYDDPPRSVEITFPELIDVFVWYADEEVNITTFSTIGMSNMPMANCEHRCEIHFALEGKTNEEETKQICSFLANLSLYPFMYKTYLDWWHVLNNPAGIPRFPNASNILFYPAFVQDGWKEINYEKDTIKILNAVPITEHENQYRKKNGMNSLLDYFYDNEINFFKDRNNHRL